MIIYVSRRRYVHMCGRQRSNENVPLQGARVCIPLDDLGQRRLGNCLGCLLVKALVLPEEAVALPLVLEIGWR